MNDKKKDKISLGTFSNDGLGMGLIPAIEGIENINKKILKGTFTFIYEGERLYDKMRKVWDRDKTYLEKQFDEVEYDIKNYILSHKNMGILPNKKEFIVAYMESQSSIDTGEYKLISSKEMREKLIEEALKLRVRTEVFVDKENLSITNSENNIKEEDNIKTKVVAYFSFLRGTDLRKHKTILEEEDFKKLIDWITYYYKNNFTIPNITKPIQKINTNKGSILVSFKYFLNYFVYIIIFMIPSKFGFFQM